MQAGVSCTIQACGLTYGALFAVFPKGFCPCHCAIFSVRQHAESAICYHKSVCLSVCPSHGWISRKRLKLGSCNFHHTVAPSPSPVCGISFIHPRAEGIKQRWVGPSRKRANIVVVLTLSPGGSTS